VTDLLTAQASALPLRQDDPVSFALIIKVMLITVMLLAIAYVVLRWYARRHAIAPAQPSAITLQCTSALRLSTKTKVYLLKVDGAHVLVTEHLNGATTTVLAPADGTSSPTAEPLP
jgi:flagellar biogenesis protein FliO